MSGLLGLADAAYHKLKGTHHADSDTDAPPNEELFDGGIGGPGSAVVGTLTGRGMGGGLHGQKAGEQVLQPTGAEKGNLDSISDE
ncbi:hypothetical protein JCM10207_000533 [Rhodosporidiobolus poonsookiae]